MPKINLEFYVFAFFIVIFISMMTISLVLKSLQNKELSIPASRTYYWYFASGTGGFLLLAIQDSVGLPVDQTTNIVFYILSSLILLLAVGDFSVRSKVKLSIQIVHLVLVAVSLLISNIEYQISFLSIYIITAYSTIGYFALTTAKKEKNIGSLIVGFTTLSMVVVGIAQLYLLLGLHQISYVYYLSVVSSATGFLMVGIGVLTQILVRQHQRLSQMATQDPLTGLLNRRGMENALRVTIEAAKRFDRYISVVVLDIDYFKKINDRYGHDAGDAVLVAVAKVLATTARQSDVCCRIGGEEFLIVLPDTHSNGVMAAAQRIRQNVSDLVVQYGSDAINATCSIGVATKKGEIDMESLLKEGDMALYSAKQNGRNQVRVASN